jgi:pimeloyl-ACP methyl ester carboxylesterase
MFAPILPALVENRQALVVELQGHGHTADIKHSFSFEQMADDVAALPKNLGIVQNDIIGYSLGVGVALQTAIRLTKLVRKLVVVSAPFKNEGWYPKVREGLQSITVASGKA